MKIAYYSLSGPITGVCKQSAVWCRTKESGLSPLVYLQRPKWITDDAAWERICRSVQLRLPRDFDVT